MSTPLLVEQVGILTFDGTGNFSGHDTGTIAGSVVPDAQFTGTYTVNPDCSVSATINTITGDKHQEGVITGQGEFMELRGMFTDTGWAFAQTLKKM